MVGVVLFVLNADGACELGGERVFELDPTMDLTRRWKADISRRREEAVDFAEPSRDGSVLTAIASSSFRLCDSRRSLLRLPVNEGFAIMLLPLLDRWIVLVVSLFLLLLELSFEGVTFVDWDT